MIAGRAVARTADVEEMRTAHAETVAPGLPCGIAARTAGEETRAADEEMVAFTEMVAARVCNRDAQGAPAKSLEETTAAVGAVTGDHRRAADNLRATGGGHHRAGAPRAGLAAGRVAGPCDDHLRGTRGAPVGRPPGIKTVNVIPAGMVVNGGGMENPFSGESSPGPDVHGRRRGRRQGGRSQDGRSRGATPGVHLGVPAEAEADHRSRAIRRARARHQARR